MYFADWLLTLFNRFFKAWLCLFALKFDRDFDDEIALRNLVLYRSE
jgi:hypothetical protein